MTNNNNANKSLSNSPMQRLPAIAYDEGAEPRAGNAVDTLARCANVLDHMVDRLRAMLVEARDARDPNWITEGKWLPPSGDPAIDQLLQLAVDYGMKLALAEEDYWCKLHVAICTWKRSQRQRPIGGYHARVSSSSAGAQSSKCQQAQPELSDFDWKPARTGDKDVDELVEMAWYLGRTVGLPGGDPGPNMCSMDCMVVAFRRKKGLRPCTTTNFLGRLEELPEWPAD
jgi:hypothetical protein